MEVSIPCPCPEKDGAPRHESDTVWLLDRLDFHRATTITKAAAGVAADSDDDGSRWAEVLATLSEFYVLMGVERWTIRDAANKPVPVTRSEIRKFILGRPEVAARLSEAADALYAETILLPLVQRGLDSSRSSLTEESTSPKPGGSQPRRPRPSKRSSISTIPTDATETTSSQLDGVSSFSQSSESAA